MKEGLVSIIIPIYNVEEYLPRTIESILAQTYTNFELVLVDDGSPDNSGKICDDYATKDNRIKVFHKSNTGAAAARKYGVEQALGEWIMFVDGDDTLPESAIQNLVSCNIADYDVTIGTLNLNNKTLFKHKHTGVLNRNEYIVALLLGETSKGPVAKLFKKELFNVQIPCPKHIKNNEDLLMLIALATKINNVFINNDLVCYNYLYREGSASKTKGMHVDAWLDLYDEIKLLLEDILNDSKVKKAFLSYRLRLLYIVATNYGYVVNPKLERVDKLLSEVDINDLKAQEIKMFKTIKSIPRQRILYFYNSSMNVVRLIIKKMINKR